MTTYRRDDDDDERAAARAERRGYTPGRRREDQSRLWSLYLMIAIQAGGMVWFAARLSASVDELHESRAQDRQVQAQTLDAVNALRSSVDVLNCRTGITCNVKNRDIQP